MRLISGFRALFARPKARVKVSSRAFARFARRVFRAPAESATGLSDKGSPSSGKKIERDPPCSRGGEPGNQGSRVSLLAYLGGGQSIVARVHYSLRVSLLAKKAGAGKAIVARVYHSSRAS